MDGVSKMEYSEYKRSNCQRTILFIGTEEKCEQYRSKYTIHEPYYVNEEIASANREHMLNWKYHNDKTPAENHKLFSEFCNENNLSLEDEIRYIFEEKEVATHGIFTVNALEQDLYHTCLEECEFKS